MRGAAINSVPTTAATGAVLFAPPSQAATGLSFSFTVSDTSGTSAASASVDIDVLPEAPRVYMNGRMNVSLAAVR